MAKTIKTYVGEAGRTLYPIDFSMGYLDKSDVYVYSGEDYNTQLSYTWVNSTQIQLATPFTLGETFYIRRIVTRGNTTNDYEDGAILSERNLDDSFKQAIMILEEFADGLTVTSGDWELLAPLKLLHNLDANNNKIINLAEPTNATDAATKGYFDGFLNLTTNQAEIAIAEATLALDYKNEAKQSELLSKDYSDSARDSALQISELLDNQGAVLNFPLDLGFITDTPVAVSYDLGSI